MIDLNRYPKCRLRVSINQHNFTPEDEGWHRAHSEAREFFAAQIASAKLRLIQHEFHREYTADLYVFTADELAQLLQEEVLRLEMRRPRFMCANQGNKGDGNG